MKEQYTCVLQDDHVTTICNATYQTVGYHDWLIVSSIVVFILVLLVAPTLFKPVKELFK